MSGRASVSMTEQEVADFLAANLKVQVASLGPDGLPHLTTLFYTLLDGRIAFWTYAKSQKILNLQRDPRVSVLVESGEDYNELMGVSIKGTAEVVTDPDRIRPIGLGVVTAMAKGADIGEGGLALVDYQVTKRYAVVITPEHTATWDHHKLSALPGEKALRDGLTAS